MIWPQRRISIAVLPLETGAHILVIRHQHRDPEYGTQRR